MGNCVGGDCPDVPCPDGSLCDVSVCVPNPCDTVTCPPGLVCQPAADLKGHGCFNGPAQSDAGSSSSGVGGAPASPPSAGHTPAATSACDCGVCGDECGPRPFPLAPVGLALALTLALGRRRRPRAGLLALALVAAAPACRGPNPPSPDSAGASLPGSGELCTPGTTIPCYDGPNGTRGVGVCVGGLATCAPNGLDFGPCIGEVTPSPETCATPVDDNCNGEVNEGSGLGCPCVDCVCKPGSTAPCYGGPPATLGIGACHGGEASCNAQGTGVGPCVGDVTPTPENCLVPGDEDCDGASTCSGPVLFSLPLRATMFARAKRVVADAKGGAVVTGTFGGTLDLGSGPIAGGMFLARFSAAGELVWVKGFSAAEPAGVAVDSSDSVILVGTFLQSIDLGGGPLASAGWEDVFVARFDAAGAPLWSRAFGGTSADEATAVGVDAIGDVVIGGRFTSIGIDFGSGALFHKGGGDMFVAKLDPAGGHLWSESFGYTGNDAVLGLGIAPDGGIVLTGAYSGTVDFGAGPITSAGPSSVVAVRLDATGACVWSEGFGGTFEGSLASVALDANGDAMLTGSFTGTLDFGTGPLSSLRPRFERGVRRRRRRVRRRCRRRRRRERLGRGCVRGDDRFRRGSPVERRLARRLPPQVDALRAGGLVRCDGLRIGPRAAY